MQNYAQDSEGRLLTVIDEFSVTLPSDNALGAWVDRDPVTVPAEPSAAQQLPNYPCTELKIIADRANTQPVYFGGANVSSTKSQDLEARDIEIVARVSNANEFYVVAAATHTGQKVRIQTR